MDQPKEVPHIPLPNGLFEFTPEWREHLMNYRPTQLSNWQKMTKEEFMAYMFPDPKPTEEEKPKG